MTTIIQLHDDDNAPAVDIVQAQNTDGTDADDYVGVVMLTEDIQVLMTVDQLSALVMDGAGVLGLHVEEATFAVADEPAVIGGAP